MAAGLIHRESQSSGRGRPRFVYGLTPVGTRALGDSQGDLAGILWRQLLSIDDAAVKQRLIMAVAGELAGELPHEPKSQSTDTTGMASDEVRCRLETVARALRKRNMPVAVEAGAEGDLPVLRFSACPYPDLSALGHDICDMETEMISQLTGLPMRLAECRCHAPDGKCTYIAEIDSCDTKTVAPASSL